MARQVAALVLLSYLKAVSSRGCFLGSALVKMADGTQRRLDQVQVGDEVLSWDEGSQQTVPSIVMHIPKFQRFRREVVTLSLPHAQVHTTEDHPFWSRGRRLLVSMQPNDTAAEYGLQSEAMQVGEMLESSSLESVEVLNISRLASATSPEAVEVATLCLHPFHWFYVHGVRVHNKGMTARPGGNTMSARRPGEGGDVANEDESHVLDSTVVGIRLAMAMLTAFSIVFLLRNSAATRYRNKLICFLVLIMVHSVIVPLSLFERDEAWLMASRSVSFAIFPVALCKLLLERVTVLGVTLGWNRTVSCLQRLWWTMVITTFCCIVLIIIYCAGERGDDFSSALTGNLVLNASFYLVFLCVAIRILLDPVVSLYAASRTLWGQERHTELSTLFSLGCKQLVAVIISLLTASLSVFFELYSEAIKQADGSTAVHLVNVKMFFDIIDDGACILSAWALWLSIRSSKSKPNADLMLKAQQERTLKKTQTISVLTSDQTPKDACWQQAVEDLASRGFTLEQLLIFYEEDLPKLMPHFDPKVSTTTDVVRHAIIPGSSEHKCAYARKMMQGVPTRPRIYVTHNWSNLFADLMASIVADALGEPTFMIISLLLGKHLEQLKTLLTSEVRAKTYWVCAFSVNQHVSICGGNPFKSVDAVTGLEHPVCSCGHVKFLNNTPPLRSDGKSVSCEMNKFDDVLAFLACQDVEFSQLIAIDYGFTLFSRAWCVAEVATADDLGLNQRMEFHSVEVFDSKVQQLHDLRVQNMKASRPEDVEEILSKIQDVDGFNSRLRLLLFGDTGLLNLSKIQDSLHLNVELGTAARLAKVMAQIPDIQIEKEAQCEVLEAKARADHAALDAPASTQIGKELVYI